MTLFSEITSKIKKLFKKPTPKVEDYFSKEVYIVPKERYTNGVCVNACGNSFFCDSCGYILNCNWIQKLTFDKNKPSILIIDDNPGVVSFLRDDIEEIIKDNTGDNTKYNILEFTGANAVYKFLATSQHYHDLNIKIAIIDITYGGSVQTNNGNVRLNGVDVFSEIYKTNKELKFCFYTGNQLNPYIKNNKEIMDYFKNIYRENISEHVLYKTSMNIDERIKYFKKKLFGL